ncbi:MAG: H4MPT-linked C1 transfer pathway protein [Candidatus Bathyarchaeota archaeon]|nr:H4MPT-linked C1 transfer pathway protein [Candidatus Bathyarchaeota archaeon]
MVDVLGLDIGGANTKAVRITIKDAKICEVKTKVEYFPVWKKPQKLFDTLSSLRQSLKLQRLDALGVTMTAELSDVYQTKREGVNHILSCVEEAFADVPIYVLNTDVELETLEAAKHDPMGVSAANWAATGWLVARHISDCVVVDIGSTSTSIIPILHGKVAACGKTDLAKLICGELVYTGSLRTNLAAVVHSIPTRNGVAGVSSELFALSGDVHLILGNITSPDYTCETADGRGKTLPEALARLARVVCADTEMLNKQEIIDMAQYIYDKQIAQVAEGLAKVYSRLKKQTTHQVPVVVTGLGKDFLARKAAESIKVDEIIDLSSLVMAEAVLATPAFGLALMTAKHLAGGRSP